MLSNVGRKVKFIHVRRFAQLDEDDLCQYHKARLKIIHKNKVIYCIIIILQISLIYFSIEIQSERDAATLVYKIKFTFKFISSIFLQLLRMMRSFLYSQLRYQISRAIQILKSIPFFSLGSYSIHFVAQVRKVYYSNLWLDPE